MRSRRLSIPLALLIVLTCASIAFFIFFGRDFPPSMIVNVGLGGSDQHMDRVKFIVLGSFVSLMLPTFIATVVGVLPRVLNPVRPAAMLDGRMWAGLWMGCAAQAVLLAVNFAIYRANLR
jgi:hypothetical protein